MMPIKVDPSELQPARVRVNPAELVRVDPSELRPVAEGPGMMESAGRGAIQGATLGFGDEAAAAIDAAIPDALMKIMPSALGGDVSREALGGKQGFLEQYKSARDYYRNRNKAAQQENPGTYLAGNIAGAIPTAKFIPSLMQAGPGLASKVMAGAANAAPVGAVAGFGAAEGDLGEQAKEAAMGGVIGGGIGGAIPLAAHGIGKTSGWLRNKSDLWAQKHLSGNHGTIADRDLLAKDVIAEARNQGAVRPFQTVGGAAEKLGKAADSAEAAYSEVVARLEQAGVKGPDIRVVQGILRDHGKDAFLNTADENILRLYNKVARNIEKVVPGEGVPSSPLAVTRRARGAMADPESATGQRILYEQAGDIGPRGRQVRSIVEEGNQGRPTMSTSNDIGRTGPYTVGKAEAPTPPGERLLRDTLRPQPDSEWGLAMSEAIPDQYQLGVLQAENIKRARQAVAKYNKVQGNTPMERANKDIASIFRQANEDAIMAQADKAPGIAEEFVPAKELLGRLLPALRTSERAAARAVLRQPIGLKDVAIAAGSFAGGAGVSGAVKAGLISKFLQSHGPSAMSWGQHNVANIVDLIGKGVSPEQARAMVIAAMLREEGGQ